MALVTSLHDVLTRMVHDVLSRMAGLPGSVFCTADTATLHPKQAVVSSLSSHSDLSNSYRTVRRRTPVLNCDTVVPS